MASTEPIKYGCDSVLGPRSPEIVAKNLATQERLTQLCKRHRVDMANRRAVYRLLKSVRNPGRYCLLMDYTDIL